MLKPIETEAHNDAMRQLRALNAKFIHNFVTNDVPSHAGITHEGFTSVTSKGARQARPAYLGYWAKAFDPEVIVYWDYRDEQITIFDNVALVRATNKHIVRKDGTETTGMTTYTDTYLRDNNGEWKCIQAQLTPVAPEHFPGDETIVAKYIKGKLQAG
jgi:ketosteroid isomerase-like protein